MFMQTKSSRQFGRATLFSSFFLILIIALGIPAYCESGAGISVDMARHAYYRGETAVLDVTCKNESSAPIKNATILASADGIQLASSAVSEIPASGIHRVTLKLNTDMLKDGKYDVKVSLGGTDEKTVSLSISDRPNPERLKVWLWDSAGWANSSFYKSLGFTSWGGPTILNKKISSDLGVSISKELDDAMPLGADVSITPFGGLRPPGYADLQGPEVYYEKASARSLGEKPEPTKFFNPFDPSVASMQDNANRALMEAVGDHPNVDLAFFNTEIVDDLSSANMNTQGIHDQQTQLGFTKDQVGAPRFVAQGVLADDDRGYLYAKYVAKRGNGVSTANKRTADMIHRYRPDVLAFTDPYRSHTLLDMFPGLDMVGTWTYIDLDPKLMLNVETLRAACVPSHQIPEMTVTLLEYPGRIAPTDESIRLNAEYEKKENVTGWPISGWMLADAGRAKIASWIILSRAPKIIGYYYSGATSPLFPNGEIKDTFKVPYSTSLAIKELSQQVFQPLGPMLTNLDIEPRKIAVLNSEAARLYGKSPALGYLYPNEEINPFLSVMAMAHLQADVVFDETVERFGLDQYDVVVLPKCDVMPKSVYDKIIAFQKRGGLVIADQYLGADIPGAVKFNFDFTYKQMVTADAIDKNTADADWNDHIDTNNVAKIKVTGVTGATDKKLMESYAAEFKKSLAGRVDPDVDCNQPTVLFNMLEKNGAKYLAVVNDNRTYGDRLGKYKAVLEKIVPQMVTIDLKKWPSPQLYAYDLVTHKALPTEKTAKGYRFQLGLTELGGTFVALYAQPIAEVRILADSAMKVGTTHTISVNVLGEGGSRPEGLQPVKVVITDPSGEVNRSDYYCAKNGALSLDFTPALNDRLGTWKINVEDNTAGFKAEKSVQVTK
jgi:hypothetical protein